MNALPKLALGGEAGPIDQTAGFVVPFQRTGASRQTNPPQPAASRGPSTSRMELQRRCATEIAMLSSLSRPELAEQWRRHFRVAAPDRIGRDILELAVAWKLQEKTLGGHRRVTETALRDLADSFGRTGEVKGTKSLRLKPGTRLLREWGGVTHEVAVLDDGFLWSGKTWRSLSAIAKVITGAHWSGPRFFGLKERAQVAVPNATMDQSIGDDEGTDGPGELAADITEQLEPADA